MYEGFVFPRGRCCKDDGGKVERGKQPGGVGVVYGARLQDGMTRRVSSVMLPAVVRG